MGCRQLIKFPAIYKDGELLTCSTDILVECENVRVLGDKKEKAWDAIRDKFMVVTGFFISFKGVEYGSLDMDQDSYFLACRNACGGNPDLDNRIHVDEFDIEFV